MNNRMFIATLERNGAAHFGVRFLRKKAANEKISVQLIKDFKPLGHTGNIVSVRPAYMRQTLHPGKIAVYTVDGPRIPVTERKVEVKPIKVSAPKLVKPKITGALSLNELSGLFGNSKNKPEVANTDSENIFKMESGDITYSASDIRELIPETNVIVTETTPLPITKEFLSKLAYESSGLEIPTSSFRILSSNKPIDVIETVGDYSWLINTPELKEVKRVINVQ